jgi:hypothetical protein
VWWIVLRGDGDGEARVIGRRGRAGVKRLLVLLVAGVGVRV